MTLQFVVEFLGVRSGMTEFHHLISFSGIQDKKFAFLFSGQFHIA